MISSPYGSPITLVSGDITFIPKFEGSPRAVADPAMGGQGGRPPPIDQNLGLALATRLRHGGKFSLQSLIFGHFFA